MSFLKNKIAWVTGASSGIGEALTYALVQSGAKVIISARREEELLRVRDGCGVHSENIIVLPFDLIMPEQINNAVAQIAKDIGRVDFLFNNGGISQRSLAIDTGIEVDRRVMEVNFFSYVALTKAVLPLMIKNGGGHLIVTSSVNGKCALPLRTAYAASKHALHGFFESLREENCNNNIKVLMVVPGFIRTNLTINAVTGDGAPYNKMGEGQEKGLPASTLAQEIIKAVEKGKKEIYVGGKDVLIIYIKRFFPALYYKIIRKVKTV